MKTIEQKEDEPINVEAWGKKELYLKQSKNGVFIDKQGARQLIEVLKEWVGEND